MYKAGVASERKERQAQEAEEKKEASKKEGERSKKRKKKRFPTKQRRKMRHIHRSSHWMPMCRMRSLSFLSLLCKLDAGGNRGKNFSEGVVVNEEFAYSIFDTVDMV